MDLLLRMQKEANSRRNFALKQVEKLFFFEERQSSNCQGKTQLENTFKLWPPENSKDKERIWKDCRKAINEVAQLHFQAATDYCGTILTVHAYTVFT